MDNQSLQDRSRTGVSRRIEMRTPEEVSAMLALQARGWGKKRIASELGCSRNTVKRWLSEGGWRSMSPVSRSKSLDGLEDWLSDRFRRHVGLTKSRRRIMPIVESADWRFTTDRRIEPHPSMPAAATLTSTLIRSIVAALTDLISARSASLSARRPFGSSAGSNDAIITVRRLPQMRSDASHKAVRASWMASYLR
jgi:hypothetical protein